MAAQRTVCWTALKKLAQHAQRQVKKNDSRSIKCQKDANARGRRLSKEVRPVLARYFCYDVFFMYHWLSVIALRLLRLFLIVSDNEQIGLVDARVLEKIRPQ